MIKLGVLISGRGSNLKAILNAIALKTLDASVEVVVSNRLNPEGFMHAKACNIPTFGLHSANFESKEQFEQKVADILHEFKVDYVVLAGYMRILGPLFIETFSNRIINIHPSLLPAFKGLNAQKQALDYGVKVAGCSVHLVNNELDGGKILAQTVVPVLPDDTEETLSSRILAQEHLLLPQTLQSISNHTIQL